VQEDYIDLLYKMGSDKKPQLTPKQGCEKGVKACLKIEKIISKNGNSTFSCDDLKKQCDNIKKK